MYFHDKRTPAIHNNIDYDRCLVYHSLQTHLSLSICVQELIPIQYTMDLIIHTGQAYSTLYTLLSSSFSRIMFGLFVHY